MDVDNWLADQPVTEAKVKNEFSDSNVFSDEDDETLASGGSFHASSSESIKDGAVSDSDSSSASSDCAESIDDGIPTFSREYNDHYLDFLNMEIEEFINPKSHFTTISLQKDEAGQQVLTTQPISKKPLRASKINGRTLWTSEEKELFFEYLGRRSRRDPAGIAEGVGTKSVIECAEYIDILERNRTTAYVSSKRRPRGIRSRWKKLMKSVPAAREMSENWIRFEEQQSCRLENYRDFAERNKDAKAWTRNLIQISNKTRQEMPAASLVRSVNGIINDKYIALTKAGIEQCQDEQEIDKFYELFGPDIHFINVENMLSVSRRLYYNQTKMSKFITLAMSSHGIQISAVKLFRELSTQFVRRLLASVLTVASMRLRLKDGQSFKRKLYDITRRDVEVACQIVGADINSFSFWQKIQTRNKKRLRIFKEKEDGGERYGGSELAKALNGSA
ncbi:hypothetical protein V1514DRAFT_332404 [Lipomyces japonicus]|uniref:uncharacterized protein n=1 Tax=Lipomyces japonicus TaxID=56871 RepID=UPI0034CE06CA